MDHVELYCAIVHHVHDALGTDATLDLHTIQVHSQKLSDFYFLQVVLPQIGKAFESSLATGRLDPFCSKRFGVRNRSDCRPKLFWQWFARVFCEEGKLLASPDPFAVQAIRQCLLVFQKVKALPNDDVIEDSLNSYRETERELSADWDMTTLDFVVKSFKLLFPNLSRISENLIPKHGRGAVAEKITSNKKYLSVSWTDRLEREFPASDYLIPSYRYWQELGDDLLAPADENPVRVVVVPKTATAARVIGIEPVHMQYMQQALFRNFTRYLNTHSVCSYSSQEPNQFLARLGSKNGNLATLDLSEASDRVHLLLVVELFKHEPMLLAQILACRSQRSKLPNGDIILLKKFASMGSALTFPIESMVFSAIALAGVFISRGLTAVRHNYRTVIGDLRVYGDDIIVPTDSAATVMLLLQTFGLKVNTSKSFWQGPFRESCGSDWCAGVDVSVVRMRRPVPTSRLDADELISLVSFRNQFTEKWTPGRLTTLLDAYIEGFIPFPAGPPTSRGLMRKTIWDSVVPEGTTKKTQMPYVTAAVPVYKFRSDKLADHGALLKFFLSKEAHEQDCEWSDPIFTGDDHLERAGRPINIKLVDRKVALNG